MDHAVTMKRLYDLIDAGDIDGFGELLPGTSSSTRKCRTGAEQARGQAALRTVQAAFPDLRMEVQDVLVSGDKAVARVRATGTHQGEFLGMPAPARASTSS